MCFRLRTSSYFAFLLLLAIQTCALAQTQPPPATDQSSQTGSITGRVVNESGQGLPNVMVWVYPAGPTTGPASNQVANTGRDGSFKLSDLPRVPYMLSATMPAYTTPPRDANSPRETPYNIGDSVTIVLIKGGVITGKVTTSAGDPVVSIGVRAEMVRDGNGRRPAAAGSMMRAASTDDRGIYRIYGLPTGTYIVVAGGVNDQSQTALNAFASDVPTYAPSATRETAAEISVRAGEEISDVDIRHRGEQGR